MPTVIRRRSYLTKATGGLDRDGPVALVAMLFLAVLGLVGGTSMLMQTADENGVSTDLTRRGVPATATVTAVHNGAYVSSYGAPQSWTDVTVAFTDTQGTRREATRDGSKHTKVGDQLSIIYDPRHPTHATWNTVSDETRTHLYTGLLGLAMGLGALMTAWSTASGETSMDLLLSLAGKLGARMTAGVSHGRQRRRPTSNRPTRPAPQQPGTRDRGGTGGPPKHRK